MRTPIIFLLSLLCTAPIWASLHPSHAAPRYVHLYEVNARWVHEVGPQELMDTTTYRSEAERIEDHLMRVWQVLRKRNTQHLSPQQRKHRTASLGQLRRYAKAGNFPINAYHSERTPYFVDELGTHCAVGYLMSQTGDAAAVERIRKKTNYGYVLEELSAYPEVEAWAQRHGFDREELAWIQPVYSQWTFHARPFGNNSGFGRDLMTGRALVATNNGFLLSGNPQTVDGHPVGSLARISIDGTVTDIPNPFDQIWYMWHDTIRQVSYLLGRINSLGAHYSQLGILDADDQTTVVSGAAMAQTRTLIEPNVSGGPIVMQCPLYNYNGGPVMISRLNIDQAELDPIAQNITLTGLLEDSYSHAGRVFIGGNLRAETTAAPGRLVRNHIVYYPDGDSISTQIAGTEEYIGNFQYDTISYVPTIYRYLNPFFGFNTDDVAIDVLTRETYNDTSRSDTIYHSLVQNSVFSPREQYARYQNGGKMLAYRSLNDHSMFLSGKLGFNSDPSRQRAGLHYRISGIYTISEIQTNGVIVGYSQLGDSVLIVGDFDQLGGRNIKQIAWATSAITSNDESPRPPIAFTAVYAEGELRLNLPEASPHAAQLHVFAGNGQVLQRVELPAGTTTWRSPMFLPQGIVFCALELDGRFGVSRVLVGDSFR